VSPYFPHISHISHISQNCWGCVPIFSDAFFWSAIICLPLGLCGYYPVMMAASISPCEAIKGKLESGEKKQLTGEVG